MGYFNSYANIYSFEHLLQYTPEPIDKCWHQEDLQSKELWQKVRFLSMPISHHQMHCDNISVEYQVALGILLKCHCHRWPVLLVLYWEISRETL